MSFTYTEFTAAFPEFKNDGAVIYSHGSFTFWQGIAAIRLDPCRWGDLLDHGAMLFIAHNMAVQARNTRTRGVAGAVEGPTTAKSIDKLSKSQDVGSVTIEGAGDWNSTTYGIQFYQLMLMFGSGGLQF